MITVTIPSIAEYTGTIPDKALQTETEFANNVYPFHLFYNDSFITDTTSFASSLNTFKTEVNATAVTMNGYAATATNAASTAQASANNKGNWSALTGALNIPASVNHNDSVWVLNVNLADVTLSEPTDINTDWTKVKSNLEDPNITGIIKEEVSISTLTLGATSSVQTYTATADFTIVDDLESGESVTLILTNGGFTPTWATTTWWDNANGTTEPTLQTTDKIKFEKVGAVLYGSHIGSIL